MKTELFKIWQTLYWVFILKFVLLHWSESEMLKGESESAWSNEHSFVCSTWGWRAVKAFSQVWSSIAPSSPSHWLSTPLFIHSCTNQINPMHPDQTPPGPFLSFLYCTKCKVQTYLLSPFSLSQAWQTLFSEYQLLVIGRDLAPVSGN